jgi:hypothetical protein
MLALSSTASADRRLFTHTYEFKTVPQGHTAIELWTTQYRPTWSSDDPGAGTGLEQIVEIEHGLTDRWDAALYTVFTQFASDDTTTPTPSIPYNLHEMKLETRYRLADRGEWPVDVLVYGELAKEFGEGVYEVEAKTIFARDFDKLTAALNVIGEIQFGSDVPETEVEVGWAAGLSYELHPKFNVGVETYGSAEEGEVAAAVGPALAFAPAGNLWATFTMGFGLTDEAAALEGRLILGIEL